MISFTTDHERKLNGRHVYRLSVETDVKKYYEMIQASARHCIDDSTNAAKIEDQEYVTPQVVTHETLAGSSRVYYVCSHCECNITPDSRGFFVYCPRCGKKIIYDNHQFLKGELDAIR